MSYAIENILLSDLKMYLIERSISKLLQNNQLTYWHKKTKTEISKLMKYLTKNQIREYIYNCYNNYDITYISIFINKHSTLKQLFTKRELFRNNNAMEFFTINNEIHKEWARMSKIVAPQYLLYYSCEVLKMKTGRQN